MFKTNPHFLYYRHEIPPENFQPELARLVEYDVSNIEHLELCKRSPRGVSKLEDFLDFREHGRDRVARVVNRFIKNFLPLKELLRHQVTVVLLHMRDYARQGVVYGVRCHVRICAR